MDSTNACQSNPGPSAVEYPNNFRPDDSIKMPDGEVLDRVKKTINSISSDDKNTKKQAKNRKLSKKLKKPHHPPILEKEAKKVSSKRTGASVVAVPSDVECPSNHNTEEDTLEVLADEVSSKTKTANNPGGYDRKNTKIPSKEGKISSKRKKPDHLPTTGTDFRKNSTKRNRSSVVALPTEYQSNTNTDENIMEIQADEVSNKMKLANNPASLVRKNTKKPAKDRKHPHKKEKPEILPMMQMVKAINDLRKRNETYVDYEASVQCSPNQTDEVPIENQSDEVSNIKKTKDDPASSYEKNTKKPAKDRKNSLKRKKLNQSPVLQTVVKANKDMDNLNRESVEGRPIESAPILETAENTMRFQATAASNKIKKANKLANSDQKISNVPANHGKLSLKKKLPVKPPTSQMVMEAIKALKKRNGSSVDAILEYMEDQYRVNAKLVKRYVTRYMKTAVQKGIIDQLGGAGDDGRFKIKRAEKIAKNRKK